VSVSENNPSQRFDLLLAIVIIVRVALIVVIWLGLFLAIFLGYFTVPIILILVLTVIYTISDLGLYFLARKNKNGNGSKSSAEQAKDLNGKD
jgi:sterol desaturase/sphingolipid hydroxylase (fatty acid hydroxylase superfamily)